MTQNARNPLEIQPGTPLSGAQDLGRKRVSVIRVRVDAVSGGCGMAWWSWLLVGLGCWLSPTLLVIAAFNIRVARVRKRSRDAGEVEHDSPADREPTRA